MVHSHNQLLRQMRGGPSWPRLCRSIKVQVVHSHNQFFWQMRCGPSWPRLSRYIKVQDSHNQLLWQMRSDPSCLLGKTKMQESTKKYLLSPTPLKQKLNNTSNLTTYEQALRWRTTGRAKQRRFRMHPPHAYSLQGRVLTRHSVVQSHNASSHFTTPEGSDQGFLGAYMSAGTARQGLLQISGRDLRPASGHEKRLMMMMPVTSRKMANICILKMKEGTGRRRRTLQYRSSMNRENVPLKGWPTFR